MNDGDLVPIEVAYAAPREQVILKLDVRKGTTLADAIAQSGILGRFPEIDLDDGSNRVGVWSRVARLDDTVGEGDRIEIYRPLIADPKEVRRQRAAQTQKK
ncbi:MAG: RnfH family protein [Nevskiales bacterium]|nr:RnfH family protein [Nevskiales bacterium]